MGRRTTSLIKKLIENVVSRTIPCLHQSLLRLSQPCLSIISPVELRFSLDSDNYASLFLQRQWAEKFQCSVFVNGFHRGSHGSKIAWGVMAGKNCSQSVHSPGRTVVVRCRTGQNGVNLGARYSDMGYSLRLRRCSNELRRFHDLRRNFSAGRLHKQIRACLVGAASNVAEGDYRLAQR